MHSATTAIQTLESIWNNYLTLGENVDIEYMPLELREHLEDHETNLQPYRLQAWLSRIGFFISAWSLWEFYSRSIIDVLPNKVTKVPNESTVDWVGKSFLANSLPFVNECWFKGGNAMRNLIAHNGARADSPKTLFQLTKAQQSFAGMDTFRDGYVSIEHDHVAELYLKVFEFIRDTNEALAKVAGI